jgi:hypothetical protein
MSSPKKHFARLVLILLTITSVNIAAKAQTDKIEGLWYNDIKSAKIQISKGADGKFNGKIIWLKEPLKNGKPKVDEENIYWKALCMMAMINIQTAKFMILKMAKPTPAILLIKVKHYQSAAM